MLSHDNVSLVLSKWSSWNPFDIYVALEIALFLLSWLGQWSHCTPHTNLGLQLTTLSVTSHWATLQPRWVYVWVWVSWVCVVVGIYVCVVYIYTVAIAGRPRDHLYSMHVGIFSSPPLSLPLRWQTFTCQSSVLLLWALHSLMHSRYAAQLECPLRVSSYTKIFVIQTYVMWLKSTYYLTMFVLSELE